MKKRKKLIIFLLLAINSLVSATTNISGKLKTTYGRLYKNIFKNSKPDNTGSANLKLFDEILINENIELKEIYIQSSQRRPEYLEWLMFSGNFPNRDINNMLKQNSDESVYSNYGAKDDKYRESILSVLAANVQRRWDKKSFDDNFVQIIEKSLERNDEDSYLELIESTENPVLSDGMRLNNVSAKAYMKGSTLTKKDRDAAKENSHYNEPVSIYINENKPDFENDNLKFSVAENSDVAEYIWFNSGEMKISTYHADNIVIHSKLEKNIQPDTDYILEYHNDYIGYGINYENKNNIKTDNKIIENEMNFLNNAPLIFVGDNGKFVFDKALSLNDAGYKDNKNENSMQLNEVSASLDFEGNLSVSLHNSGIEFFEPFIIENRLSNKEKDFLSISEEAASSQSAKMKNEKSEEYEAINNYILLGVNENTSKVIDNSISLLGETEEVTEEEKVSDNADSSLNYFTLSGILDNKQKHIYSYLDYGIGRTSNLDEIIPKAQYEKYMVNDWDLRNDLMERLNRSRLLSNNDLNETEKEYKSSWRLKASLDFTHNFNS
jgi:hypothetical protein